MEGWQEMHRAAVGMGLVMERGFGEREAEVVMGEKLEEMEGKNTQGVHLLFLNYWPKNRIADREARIIK